eukprot:CAMPEP_0170520830 /NCGR_PEP_ID=MMETSP0209-20121228/6151_1 /TAXON_ID=665100 ORGANISM="Litonotus pictus, Strain P1" /NCGR_SAMPLE_ID=MMETSP0209 /ASSEMBLY_ACC=CAM_ASM_000301 /LENGTH=153 /DNA_ID=CAMNT_0010807385 /DNA_START=98 /DNA_END=559 /DNA_ORIENTATION=-
MSVFITFCMICIFSLESLGLMNNEKNLSYRMAGPEGTIKLLHEEKRISENCEGKESETFEVCGFNQDAAQRKAYGDELQGSSFSSNMLAISINTREERLGMINDILLSAAGNQFHYEVNSTIFDSGSSEGEYSELEREVFFSEEDESLQFFDI